MKRRLIFWFKPFLLILLMAGLAALTGCSGDDGAQGPQGLKGDTGAPGPVTATEESCDVCHGLDPNGDPRLLGVANFMDVNDYVPNFGVEITDIVLTDAGGGPGTGGVVVDFTVTTSTGAPGPIPAEALPSGVKVNLAKLVQEFAGAPPVATSIFTWQDYYNEDAAADGPAGSVPVMATAIQATAATCVVAAVTDGSDGLYTCTDTTDLTAVAAPLAVTWEPTLTHRLAIYFGSHLTVGMPGNGWSDFIPQTIIDGGTLADAEAAVVDTRDIADTASCDECHGQLHGHGGDRVTVAICVTCHNPGTTDPDSGLSMDMASMIHSIHLGNLGGADAVAHNRNVIAAGTAHPAIVGEDGAVLRTEDYVVGHRGNNNDFSEIGYPNRLDNCEKCHTAADAATPDGDNPLTVPSILACVSCHDQTSWDATHAGRTDNGCTVCHSGALSIAATHEFTTTDYVTTITLEADGDADGVYEVGDAPLITITVEDGAAADVGGYTDAQDVTYSDARVYIYGPRAKSAPVLATGSSTDVVTNWNEISNDGIGNDNGVCSQAEADAGGCAPQQSHNLWVGGTDPLVMTDANGFKYQTLAIPAGMTAGTYMVMARIALADADETRVWALTTFNINTDTEELKVAGNGCRECHDLVDYSSMAHRSYFGTDGCLACHDQSNNHADPIANRVHAVHSASALSDLTISGGFSRDWTDITYPQVVSHCKACHTSGNESFQSNPHGFSCVGCHGDTPGAKDHMIQMGADFPEPFLTEGP